MRHKNIYKTFIQKTDTIKRGRPVEIQLVQPRYRDTSNAQKTVLKSVLERYLAERLRIVKDQGKEKSRFNIIMRDDRADQGLTHSTINRESSFMSVAIKKMSDNMIVSCLSIQYLTQLKAKRILQEIEGWSAMSLNA